MFTHKHLKNAESLNVISGSADLLIFDNKGNIKKKILISDKKKEGILSNEKINLIV